MIRGSIEYTCVIFSLKKSTLFSKLEKIQNSTIRTCLGLRCSTPINILHAETCEPPFKLRFEYLASKFLISSLAITNHSLIDKLEDLTFTANSNRSRNYLENNYLLYTNGFDITNSCYTLQFCRRNLCCLTRSHMLNLISTSQTNNSSQRSKVKTQVPYRAYLIITFEISLNGQRLFLRTALNLLTFVLWDRRAFRTLQAFL